jgi:hypothetical protein
MRGAFGAHRFDHDAVRTWWWTTFVPHATLWVGMTVISGVLLGLWPFLRGRRAAA